MTRNDWIKLAALIVITVPWMLGLSYLLALAQHPTAYWLWHTVLGVM